ncbi:hypothetical protein [Streptomyces violaceusniger]|uniref:hypothetical protein n=1 Tax=Streptomyces violaceusniger TaxID=68280 RepID=UPI0036936F84
MSIILEKPALSEAGTITLSVPMDVTRDMLAYALADAGPGGWGTPDSWPVEFIRDYVKVELSVNGSLRAEQDAHLLRREAERDPVMRAYVEALYRSIDRAYPELAPAVTS